MVDLAYWCLVVLKVVATCLASVILLVLVLLLIAVIRTLFVPSKRSEYVPKPDEKREKKYAGLLSEMVRCDTTSFEGQKDVARFEEFHRVLERLFPLVHEKLEKTDIDGNLLFKWEGKSSDKPVVLMSHQDVVPAEGEWTHGPFSGDIADGKVWGRGSSDTKCSVMAFFQAVEELLEEGFVPESDVYLSSSCTEEWAGDGCPKLVEEMKRRGVRPYIVIDEGGGIITDPIGGVKGNFAMVGIFEKGKADIVFKAKSNGGHASTPKPGSPLARLSDLVSEIEHKDPFKRKLLPEVKGMFRALCPYAPFGLKLVFSNLWLFGPVLLRLLPKISAQAGAMIRTTIAFTMAGGSDAPNVMPQEAFVGANVRFIPHQGMDESLKILDGIAKKHDAVLETGYAIDYSEASRLDGEEYAFLQAMIEKTFPGIPVSPYVMTGATDARNYREICDCVYRFAPVIYGPEQMKGMHGLNENIEYNCLPGAVDFYKNVIVNNKTSRR
ncbi:MAG: M20/M25/M40 family metallo-hydrolase [Lachnospiraceae bacterium]|nr:M20/M25/M40 family metallo-hydrolase [Lachnospiraceae bacterium]